MTLRQPQALPQHTQANRGRQPLFTIAVTTYDRLELLREALMSIIGQTFLDLEIIVGNDNPEQPLSKECLGIDDSRIFIINHESNLGEMDNMNALLKRSRGRYFSWLADDDFYHHLFLETIHKVLIECQYPPVVFTSYTAGERLAKDIDVSILPIKNRLLTGSQFIQAYLSRDLKAIGCYGVFQTEDLRAMGGMEKLGHGFSPYSDNLLAIRSGLFNRVAYIDAPLILFRTSEKSISFSSTDLNAYASAQKDLLSKSCDVFLNDSLRNNFQSNLFLLIEWCVRDFYHVVCRTGFVTFRQLAEYFRTIRRYSKPLKGSVYSKRALLLLLRTARVLVCDIRGHRVRLKIKLVRYQ
jgi:glycosyltransferase involved in cell wall biosynthesis